MMSFLRLAGMAVLLVIPGAVRAQEANPVSFGFSGGLSLPLSDLANSSNSGYSVAGHIFFKPASGTRLLYRGDVSYDRWGAKPAAGNNVVDASFTAMGFAVNAIMSTGAKKSTTRPYLLAGAGFYRTNLKISGSATGLTTPSSDMGIQVGGGTEFKLSGLSTYLEAKYVNVFRNPTSWSYLPITFGVRF